MARLAARDRGRLAAIRDELNTIRLDRRNVMEVVLGEIRELIGTDGVVAVCPVERIHGWDLERFDHDRFVAATGFARLFTRFLDDAPRRYAWYDAVRPEPEQRNVVVEAIGRIPEGEYERSRIYAEVFQPLGLERHRQLRALVCDGPSLLAWFGVFHDGPVEDRHREILRRLVAPVRRRFTLERRLAAGSMAASALEAALDRLGAPAYVVDGRARVCHANAAGRALLDQRGAEVAVELAAAVHDRAGSRAFDVTPLRERGTPRRWLAIARSGSPDARAATAVSAAARRWGLTARQTEVLGHVVDGKANAFIAATLGVGARAVELHVSAILDRVGVDNRAALVAAVLLGE